MVGRFAVALLLVGCGPRVGGDDQGSGDGTADEGTSTSTTSSGTSTASSAATTSTADASSSETGEPGCEREPMVQWEVFGPDLDAWPAAAAATADGRIVVVGRTREPNVGDTSDATIELRNLDGTVVWSVTYAGANGFDDAALDVAVDAEGDAYVLVGETVARIQDGKSPSSDQRLVVLRYDSAGERVWRWERERPPRETDPNHLVGGEIEVVDGRLLVLEYPRYTNDDLTNLFELDRAGTFVSEVRLETDTHPAARDLGRDGEVVILDWGEGGAAQTRLTRFASDGAEAWTTVFGVDEEDPLQVIAGPSGETYVAYGIEKRDVDTTVHLRRFEPDGSEGWTQPLLVTMPYMPEVAGDVAPDGGVLVTASYRISPTEDVPGNEPLWVARYAPDGSCREWLLEHPFPSPETPSSGDVVVGIGDDAALVIATYGPNHFEPWMGLVGD